MEKTPEDCPGVKKKEAEEKRLYFGQPGMA